jgi:hypothetical protein
MQEHGNGKLIGRKQDQRHEKANFATHKGNFMDDIIRNIV